MAIVLLIWSALAIRLAQCQYGSTTVSAYASESAVPLYYSTDGTFQWPAGSGAADFSEGALMNVSWTTQWESVNLWLIINEQWDEPYSIASNYAKSSISWTVACPNNACQYPFLFRIVNAQGSDDEQQHGGFYTRLFWIRPTTESTTTSSTLTPVSTTGNLLPSSASQTSTSRTTKASTSPSSTSKPAGSGSDNTVAIGVGVGVGVGVVLLGIGGFFLWRRHHKKKKEQYSRPQSEMASSTPGHGTWSWFDATPATANAKWAPPQYQQGPVEADAGQENTLVEAPSWTHREPQELEAPK